MRTVAAPRPPRLYSVLSTTIGSLPCMITLPARISCAIFMVTLVWCGALDARFNHGSMRGAPMTRDKAEPPLRAKPAILPLPGHESDELGGQVRLGAQAL